MRSGCLLQVGVLLGRLTVQPAQLAPCNGKTPYTSFTTPTMSPLTSIREESNKSPSSSAKPLNITRGSINQPEKLSLEKLDEFVKEASAGEKSPLFDKERHADGGCGGNFKLNIGERLTLVQESLDEEKPPNIVKPSISYSRSQPEDFFSVLTAFPDIGLEHGADHHSSEDHLKYVLITGWYLGVSWAIQYVPLTLL